MRFDQEQTTNSPSATTITHNVTLSFEIGASNISVPIRSDQSGPKQDGGQVLIYYAGEGLKKSTSLGYHTNCVYSPITGKYMTKHNPQKENAPAVIYSIGDKRRLIWRCRHMSANDNGRKVWKQQNDNILTFELDSDTMTIIYPEDKNPKSENSKKTMSQYMYGGVHLSGEKLVLVLYLEW